MRIQLQFFTAACIATLATGMPLAAQESKTIFHLLGIPQAAKCLGDGLLNRNGNQPGLEFKPPVKKLADPANLEEGQPPIVQEAAKVKQQEDLKRQKIKAVKYLTQHGCSCYDRPKVVEGKDGESVEVNPITDALISSLQDCTEEVRFATVRYIKWASESNKCQKCGSRSCCKEDLVKELARIAYDIDNSGCYIEPSERVRGTAKEALRSCCPGSMPIQIVQEVTTPQPVPIELIPTPEPEPESVDPDLESVDEEKGEGDGEPSDDTEENASEAEGEATEEDGTDGLDLDPDPEDLDLPSGIEEKVNEELTRFRRLSSLDIVPVPEPLAPVQAASYANRLSPIIVKEPTLYLPPASVSHTEREIESRAIRYQLTDIPQTSGPIDKTSGPIDKKSDVIDVESGLVDVAIEPAKNSVHSVRKSSMLRTPYAEPASNESEDAHVTSSPAKRVRRQPSIAKTTKPVANQMFCTVIAKFSAQNCVKLRLENEGRFSQDQTFNLYRQHPTGRQLVAIASPIGKNGVCKIKDGDVRNVSVGDTALIRPSH